jgi:hypothetical protein
MEAGISNYVWSLEEIFLDKAMFLLGTTSAGFGTCGRFPLFRTGTKAQNLVDILLHSNGG